MAVRILNPFLDKKMKFENAGKLKIRNISLSDTQEHWNCEKITKDILSGAEHVLIKQKQRTHFLVEGSSHKDIAVFGTDYFNSSLLLRRFFKLRIVLKCDSLIKREN